MIRYALACDKRHEFESWFKNSAAFDKQAARKLVACPVCGSTKVEKTIMAPRLSRTTRASETPIAPAPATEQTTAPTVSPAPTGSEDTKASVAIMSPQEQELRKKLKELKDHLTQNANYVGAKFPEEARKMHYGETEQRSIFGEASPEDAKQLHEEGIEFLTLPVLPDERN
jgi:hypothetical protein